MYNRYIPRPDGSYSCSRIPEPRQNHPHSKPPAPPHQSPCDEPKENIRSEKKPAYKPDRHPLGFLRQLFGKDFDTGDLVVILLLLLMAGDCEEDRNNALLTIALYFMM